MSTNLNDKDTKVMNNDTDEYTYQPRSRAKKTKTVVSSEKAAKTPKEKKSINKLFYIIPAAIIASFLIAIVTYTLCLPKGVIASNVQIAGIDVGGKNVEEAKKLIEGFVDEKAVYHVQCGEHSTKITAKDISLEIDSDATVNKAMNICKSKNIFVDSWNAVGLLFGKKNIEAEFVYNVEQLDKMLFDFGSTFNGLSTKQQYTYTNDSMTIIPATPGQNPDVSMARGEFIKAVGLGKTTDIKVTLDYAEPKLLDADEVYNEICVPAQDATYARDDAGQVIVNEHKIGVEVKKEDLKNVVSAVNEGKSATCAAVITMPKKTKEVLETKLFNGTLGSHTTDFSTSSTNRAYNVSLAAKSVNDTILLPGEEFSYNNTIGNANAANGYKMAGIYSNGKQAEGVGGGICQVSSTLYSAVLYADLEIVERKNHSLTVSYVPNGQDATVSYGVIDFRFKNNTEYPVKLKSVVNGRKLTISVIGTSYEPTRTVKITHQTISSTPPTDNETVDENGELPAGITRKVIEKGKTGYVVDSYKTVYENGVEVSSKKISRSTYRMVPNEVLVAPEVTDAPVEDVPTDNPVVDAPDGGESEVIPDEPTQPETPITKPVERPAPNDE